MTITASPIRMLAIFIFITAISFHISGTAKAEQLQEMPDDEAIVLLTRLADSWERCLKQAPYVSGRAKVNQELYTKTATFNRIALKNKTQGPQFEKLVRAMVSFKSDFQKKSHRSHWLELQPSSWRDQANGKLIKNALQPVESVSVLTEEDYYYCWLGVQSMGHTPGPSTAELSHIDVQQNRECIGCVRMIGYRDSPRVGHQLTERLQMFDSSRLLKIGGQYPDQFLRNVVRHLETGDGVRISLIKKQPEVLLILVPYRGSTAGDPVLFLESTWLASQDPAGPKMLLESVRMTLEDRFQAKAQNGEKTKSIYQTVWKWNSERLKQGLVVPASWDYVVSGNASTTSGFHRYVEIEKWDLVESFSEQTFSPAALNLQIGDLLFDKEHRVLSYQAANNRFIKLSD